MHVHRLTSFAIASPLAIKSPWGSTSTFTFPHDSRSSRKQPQIVPGEARALPILDPVLGAFVFTFGPPLRKDHHSRFLARFAIASPLAIKSPWGSTCTFTFRRDSRSSRKQLQIVPGEARSPPVLDQGREASGKPYADSLVEGRALLRRIVSEHSPFLLKPLTRSPHPNLARPVLAWAGARANVMGRR